MEYRLITERHNEPDGPRGQNTSYGLKIGLRG